MSQKNLEKEKTTEASSSPPSIFSYRSKAVSEIQNAEQKKNSPSIKNPESTNCSTCGIEFGLILDKQKIWFGFI